MKVSSWHWTWGPLKLPVRVLWALGATPYHSRLWTYLFLGYVWGSVASSWGFNTEQDPVSVPRDSVELSEG